MKNFKFIIFSMALIFIIGLTQAQECKINTPVNLQLTCTVNNQIPTDSATYNLSVYYPNGSNLVNNVQAQAQGQIPNEENTTPGMAEGLAKEGGRPAASQFDQVGAQ
jgi:hypothetical protein